MIEKTREKIARNQIDIQPRTMQSLREGQWNDGLRVCLTLLRHCVKGAFSKVLSVRYFDIATLTS